VHILRQKDLPDLQQEMPSQHAKQAKNFDIADVAQDLKIIHNTHNL